MKKPTRQRWFLLPALVLAAVAAHAEPPRQQLQHVGTLTHPPLREASALVKSRKHAGVFWTLNDSGNAPHLFAIDRTGKLLAEYRVRKAPDVDWEAMTQDDEGNLYVGDVGNNVIRLSRRYVYQIKEPDPLTPYDKDKPLPELHVEKKFAYVFPEKPFDVEAMIFQRGSLYLFSKVHGKNVTKLYRMALDAPGKDVTLEEVCTIPGLNVVTDAALTPDGKRLALCSYDWAAQFNLDTDEPLSKLKDKKPTVVRFPPTEIEGCAWDGDELIMVSESRDVYAIKF